MASSTTDNSANFAAAARERINGALSALKSVTASTTFEGGDDENVDDSLKGSPARNSRQDLGPVPSSSTESPVESDPSPLSPPLASVCGVVPDDATDGGATVQQVIRYMFGSCTSNNSNPAGAASAKKAGGRETEQRSRSSSGKDAVARSSSRSHQRHVEDEENFEVDGGRSRGTASRKSKKSQATHPRANHGPRGDGHRSRNHHHHRDRDVTLTEIETQTPKDEGFYANFYADDHARLKGADGSKAAAGEPGVPASPAQQRQKQHAANGATSSSSPKAPIQSQATSAQCTADELIQQAQHGSSPYRVSEVQRLAPAASTDSADAESFCYDDGISALSAHTLEEMARANPLPPKRSTRNEGPPSEEGFNITIEPALSPSPAVPSELKSSMGRRGSSHNESSASSSPVPSPVRTDGSNTPTSSKNDGGGDNKATAVAKIAAAAVAATSTPLRSKSRRVVDKSAEIHAVDESGDGVGRLPPSPSDVARMRSNRTQSSRTTQTSASTTDTHDFENAWRKDEAQYWEEEVKRDTTSVDVGGGGAAVDEDGFPVKKGAEGSAAFTPANFGPTELAKARKQLTSRSRSNDLTAPTAAMTTAHTISTGASTPSRHPHDTLPLDLADCVPTTPVSASTPVSSSSGSSKAKRRKSRRQKFHDGLIRRGRRVMKGGYHPQENSMGPTNEIYVRNDVEVGEI